MTGSLPAQLVDLAHAKGVSTDYWDWQGQHTHIPEEALRKVLTALGVDVSTDAAVRESLHRSQVEPWTRTLPPTVVARSGQAHRFAVHVPHGSSVTVTMTTEGGERVPLTQVEHNVEPLDLDGALVGEAAFEVPADAPLGWHELEATVAAEVARPETTRATLVVTPASLELPEILRERPVNGLMTQLYQARSRRSWGIGDLADLATLTRWAVREHDAHFVLVNPLHAAEPVSPIEASPYLPTSRRFANPIYIDVDALPGAADLPAATRAEIDRLGEQARALLTGDTIDRDAVWALKRKALRAAFTALGHGQAEELAAYHAREGEGLVRFATWCALAEQQAGVEGPWPESLRDPSSPAVATFQAENGGTISFYVWLQWVLEEQLAQAQQAAREAGMGIGVVHDLAVGIHPAGADAWSLADVLATGVTVGAPPDQFNQLGQDWSQPPWRPDALAEAGYRPYRDLLRSVLRDAGGLRIDHIIGLFRLWWIPDGHTAADGAYVRYDHEALIGILALEAQRAGAVVIGEDLGVVEPWVRTYLAERGVLGTSVVWFEWDDDGRPRRPETYRDLCLATVTTHDLPPSAGYLELEHVRIREELGLLTRPVLEEEESERATLRRVREALVERGLLTADEAAEGGDVQRVVDALHAWLAQTPSRLHGLALTDLVGDRRAINQPGTNDEYPNWRLPLTDAQGRPVLLEDLPTTR